MAYLWARFSVNKAQKVISRRTSSFQWEDLSKDPAGQKRNHDPCQAAQERIASYRGTSFLISASENLAG